MALLVNVGLAIHYCSPRKKQPASLTAALCPLSYSVRPSQEARKAQGIPLPLAPEFCIPLS